MFKFENILMLFETQAPLVRAFPGSNVSWAKLNMLPRPIQKTSIGIDDWVANQTRNIPNAELSGPVARFWGNAYPGIL